MCVANDLLPLLIHLLRFLNLGAVKIVEHVKVFLPLRLILLKKSKILVPTSRSYIPSPDLQSNMYMILISLSNARPSYNRLRSLCTYVRYKFRYNRIRRIYSKHIELLSMKQMAPRT